MKSIEKGEHTLNLANKQAAKVALVTGAGRRIGACIAQALHTAGYKVVVHCHHSVAEAEKLVKQLNDLRGDSAFLLVQDLLAPNAAENMLQALKQWVSCLNVLVNNASIFSRTDWDTQFAINVQVPYLLSTAAQSLLAQNQGVIINITDIHAQKPLKGYAIYCQTKAALEMQTKALALEFAPEIRVNAVAPGPTLWPEQENSLHEEEKQKIIAKTLVKSFGDPEYIAQAVLGLIENPYISGQILQVDGGRSIR
jgi:pteridine reductase